MLFCSDKLNSEFYPVITADKHVNVEEQFALLNSSRLIVRPPCTWCSKAESTSMMPRNNDEPSVKTNRHLIVADRVNDDPSPLLLVFSLLSLYILHRALSPSSYNLALVALSPSSTASSQEV